MNTPTYKEFDELLFCDIQINHYAELYKQRMIGWRFKSAFFAWKRMDYYKQLRLELNCIVKELLTEINNLSHARPTITITIAG